MTISKNSSNRVSFKHHLAGFCIVVTMALACYSPSFQNGLSRDDVFIFEHLRSQPADQNIIFTTAWLTNIMESSGKSGLFRPVTQASFLLDYRMWGLNPGGFHATNVILHVMAGMLFFAALYRISTGFFVSLAAAVLFTVHPVQFEAVGLIHNRSDIFCAAFLLITFLLFDSYLRNRKNIFLIFSALSYFLGVCSKESAVFFPVALWAYEYFVFGAVHSGSAIKQRVRLYGMYLCFFLCYLMVRQLSFGGDFHLQRYWNSYNFLIGAGVFERPTVVLNILGQYLILLADTFNPFSFCGDYFIPVAGNFLNPQGFLGLTTVIGLVYLVYRHKDFPAVIFGAAWFVMTYFPISNIIPIGNMFAEHFMYIPSVGIFTLVSVVFAQVLKKDPKRPCLCTIGHKLPLIVLALIIMLLSRSTFLRNDRIKDDKALWFYTAQHPLASPRAHAVLGQYYLKAGQLNLAENELQKTLGKNPAYFPAYVMLGHIYKREKLYEKARKYFLKGAEYSKAHNDLEFLRDALAELKSLDGL